MLFGVQASASSSRVVPATGNELTGLATAPVPTTYDAQPLSAALAGTSSICLRDQPNPSTSLVYGVPGCGDLPGQPVCARRCFVSETAVGREPVVTGRCGESWQSRGPLTVN